MATNTNETIPANNQTPDQVQKPKSSKKHKKKKKKTTTTTTTTTTQNNQSASQSTNPPPINPPPPPSKQKKKKKKKSPKMNQPSNQTLKPQTMFPLLHDAVTNAISPALTNPPLFHATDTTDNCKKQYETNVMGRFKCRNNACSKDGWNSKVVAIVIRKYHGNTYNAVVYNQRCKNCDRLGELTMNEVSYVERVGYRLVKWGGVAVETPPYEEKKGPPHERAYCEGCKNGVCKQGRQEED